MLSLTLPMTTDTHGILNPPLVDVQRSAAKPQAAARLGPLAADSFQALQRPYERIEWMLFLALMITTTSAIVLGFWF